MPVPSILRKGKSLFSFLPEKGCQWVDLQLAIPNGSFANKMEKSQSENLPQNALGSEAVSILQGYKENEGFFSSGNFCMFPWVNRMWPNSFVGQKELSLLSQVDDPKLILDGNGFPLHGTVYDQAWKQLDNSTRFELEYIDPIQRRKCRLEQNFNLSESSFMAQLKIQKALGSEWNYSIGFHPYFRLPLGSVDDWELELHGNVYSVPLDEKCFPIPEFLQNSASLPLPTSKLLQLRDMHLDHLYYFPEGLQVSLSHPELAFSLYLSSEYKVGIDFFPFCQIYTPSNRECIAIEPMITPGNFENVYNKYMVGNLQKNENFFQFSLHLQSKY